jgi:4'-phosphopantetheinyl transferase
LDLWLVDLTQVGLASCAESLSSHDLQRASRFVFDKDRDAFLQSRLALRTILGYHAQLPAHAIDFRENQYGKPFLPADCGIDFNLSHSGSWAAIVVGSQCAIGVDIEKQVLPGDLPQLARMVFSSDECEQLASIGDDRAARLAFTAGWTRKEACLKAVGCGFSLDPRQVEVGLTTKSSRVQVPNILEPIEVTTIAAVPNNTVSVAVVGSSLGSIRLRRYVHSESLDSICQPDPASVL